MERERERRRERGCNKFFRENFDPHYITPSTLPNRGCSSIFQISQNGDLEC